MQACHSGRVHGDMAAPSAVVVATVAAVAVVVGELVVMSPVSCECVC